MKGNSMGQAFDEHGNVLGEAYGSTKKEVLEKLMQEHMDAHEIRIKKMKTESESSNKESLNATSPPEWFYAHQKITNHLRKGDLSEKQVNSLWAMLKVNFGPGRPLSHLYELPDMDGDDGVDMAVYRILDVLVTKLEGEAEGSKTVDRPFK
jgi:hypothetical protein